MKINWGIGAGLVLAVFCIVMTTVVILANPGEIEEDNYYEKDISNRDDLRKTKNAKDLKEPIRFESDKFGLKIIFPSKFKKENTEGIVSLMRYSDSRMDRKYDIVFSGENFMLIPRKDLNYGPYKITVSWNNKIDSYLTVQDIQWK
ncbi:MAG: FixH family protein [Flavobacteriales bacterium]